MHKKRIRLPSMKCGTCGLPIKPILAQVNWCGDYFLYAHIIPCGYSENAYKATEYFCEGAVYTAKHYGRYDFSGKYKDDYKSYRDWSSHKRYLAHPEKHYIGRMFSSKKHMRRVKGYVKKTKEVIKGPHFNLLGPKRRKFKEFA